MKGSDVDRGGWEAPLSRQISHSLQKAESSVERVLVFLGKGVAGTKTLKQKGGTAHPLEKLKA